MARAARMPSMPARSVFSGHVLSASMAIRWAVLKAMPQGECCALVDIGNMYSKSSGSSMAHSSNCWPPMLPPMPICIFRIPRCSFSGR